jgi:guanine deaminase
MYMDDPRKKFMDMAIDLARQGMNSGVGGPFGCVIVKDNMVVARGMNSVTSTNDPTAHAEVVAIRKACAELNTYQLTGCDLYTSCEPCPMCLGAIYWARPDNVYYACTRHDAADAGFDDHFIYDQLQSAIELRKIPMENIERMSSMEVFAEWKKKENKQKY